MIGIIAKHVSKPVYDFWQLYLHGLPLLLLGGLLLVFFLISIMFIDNIEINEDQYKELIVLTAPDSKCDIKASVKSRLDDHNWISKLEYWDLTRQCEHQIEEGQPVTPHLVDKLKENVLSH